MSKVNWAIIKERINSNKLSIGSYYRAITFDGDIFYGELSFVNKDKVELQAGNGDFKSFNRGNTKFVKLSCLDCQ